MTVVRCFLVAAVLELGLLAYLSYRKAATDREILNLCEIQSGLAACRRDPEAGGCDQFILPTCRAYLGSGWATGTRP